DRKLPVCPHNEQDEMTRTSRFAGSMLSIGFCLVGTSSLGGCQQSSQPGKQDAAAVASDLVLINGKFLTVDPNDSVAQAVAISNGKIVAVGNNADVQSRAAKNARVIDLHGRTATPGLIDAHGHFADGGIAELYAVKLGDATSIDDVLSRVRERVA